MASKAEVMNNITEKKILSSPFHWKLIKNNIHKFTDEKSDGFLDEDSHFLSQPLASLLYTLNLLELKPSSNSNYVIYETKRKKYCTLRAFIENFLLEEIKYSDHQKTLFAHYINDKDSLFKFLLKYIRERLNNNYVNWFERFATIDDAKSFVKEYGADQVYFTQYLSQLSVVAPEKAAIEIYSNLFDETGLDSSSREKRDFSLFHPEIFRRLYSYFSIKSVDRFHHQEEFNPETYYCICMMLLSIRLGYLQGAGALFFLESSIPEQLSKINNGLKRLGVPDSERLFLEIHCELDEVHTINWWNYAIKDYLATQQDLSNLLLGIEIAISARNQLWDGLLIRSQQ